MLNQDNWDDNSDPANTGHKIGPPSTLLNLGLTEIALDKNEDINAGLIISDLQSRKEHNIPFDAPCDHKYTNNYFEDLVIINNTCNIYWIVYKDNTSETGVVKIPLLPTTDSNGAVMFDGSVLVNKNNKYGPIRQNSSDGWVTLIKRNGVITSEMLKTSALNTKRSIPGYIQNICAVDFTKPINIHGTNKYICTDITLNMYMNTILHTDVSEFPYIVEVDPTSDFVTTPFYVQRRVNGVYSEIYKIPVVYNEALQPGTLTLTSNITSNTIPTKLDQEKMNIAISAQSFTITEKVACYNEAFFYEVNSDDHDLVLTNDITKLVINKDSKTFEEQVALHPNCTTGIKRLLKDAIEAIKKYYSEELIAVKEELERVTKKHKILKEKLTELKSEEAANEKRRKEETELLLAKRKQNLEEETQRKKHELEENKELRARVEQQIQLKSKKMDNVSNGLKSVMIGLGIIQTTISIWGVFKSLTKVVALIGMALLI